MKFSRKARRELSWILLFASSVPLVHLLFYGQGGFLQLGEYRTRLQQIQRANRTLLEENRRVAEKIRRVKTDPREVERIAREEHNMARPGDVIITLPKDDE